MRNLTRVALNELVEGQEVYVYGKAYVYAEERLVNYPGRKVKVGMKADDGIRFNATCPYRGVIRLGIASKLFKQDVALAPPPAVKVEEETNEQKVAKALQQAREACKDIRENGLRRRAWPKNRSAQVVEPSTEGIALVGFIYEDGSWGFDTNTACHAAMQSYPKKGSNPVYVVSYMKDEALDEDNTAYFKWLFNFSPYASAFVTKDPKEGFETGIILDCNAESNIVAGGAIATRIPTEWSGRCKLWNIMVKSGINHMFAFFFIHSFDIDGDSRIFSSPMRGHMPLDSEETISDVKANLNAPYVYNKSPVYHKRFGYANINKLFKTLGGQDFYNSLCYPTFRIFCNKAEEGKAVVNPFRVKAQVVPVKYLAEMVSAILSDKKWIEA